MRLILKNKRFYNKIKLDKNMINYQSKKWQLFGSRPTSILKRDFMKWTYLSSDGIGGLKLTKLMAISDGREMDIFVNIREDEKNYE